MQPLLSVITTVYNTEKYVNRCIDSIINQSYKNIEIIIVNNGSEGNIKEIVRKYKELYQNIQIKLVDLKNNIGLVHGYIAGTEVAIGDYITFIDSDDRISLDYYRVLLQKAEETGADMVAADFVYEFEDGEMLSDDYNPLSNNTFILENNDIFDLYMKQGARSFYWNLMWNKIYSKKLWELCYPYIKNKTKKLVLCQDIVFSTVFYAFSKKFVNVHNVEYYYLKRKLSGTDSNNDPKRFKSQIDDLKEVFKFFELFIKEKYGKKYDQEIKAWKDRYYRYFCSFIKEADLSSIDKKSLLNNWKYFMNQKTVKLRNFDDIFFQRFHTNFNDSLEKIRESISNEACEYVSFDVFDTLIVRPFWEPKDIFKQLNLLFAELVPSSFYISFSEYRIIAENNIRKQKNAIGNADVDITLDMIYDELKNMLGLPKDICEKLKNAEENIEIEYCYRRETGKLLYDFAVSLNKKIIFISDMYLSSDILKIILVKNGYINFERIFVSNEAKHTKSSGYLYEYVKKELGIYEYNNIVHIGDNSYSDVYVPLQKGIKAYHLPRTVDTFLTTNLYKSMYAQEQSIGCASGSTWNCYGSRMFFAIIANKLFDNPFFVFKDGSEFNADPYFVGYLALGPYIFAAAKWCQEITESNQYNKIHFLSRDGYLIKKAYDKYVAAYGGCISDYIHISRNALLPFMFKKEVDVLSFPHFLYYGNYNPEKFLNILKNVLNSELDEIVKDIEKEGFIKDRFFSSEDECVKFLVYLRKKYFSRNKLIQFYDDMKNTFHEFIKSNECTFDVGYSSRPEVILGNLLDEKIDGLMLYKNEEKCSINSSFAGINTYVMNNYFPPIANEMLIELLISDTGDYCDGYELIGNKYLPRFKKNDISFSNKFMIEILQNAALEFVDDVLKRTKGINKIQYYKLFDMTYPLEYYIRFAPQIDMAFLTGNLLDEDKDRDIKTDITNIRFEYIFRNKSSNEYLSNFIIQPKWKKVIYWSLFDRNILKSKIKNRYKNSPLFLELISNGYKLMKKLYYLCKSK